MLFVVALGLLAIVNFGGAEITPFGLAVPETRQTRPVCPASCCKRYCATSATAAECTPATPVTTPPGPPTCKLTGVAAKQCINITPNCGPTVCTARATCNTPCGTVLATNAITICA